MQQVFYPVEQAAICIIDKDNFFYNGMDELLVECLTLVIFLDLSLKI